MLKITPIPESEADKEILKIYTSVKQTFGLAKTPLIFQYLASFPDYLAYLWQQTLPLLHDDDFKRIKEQVVDFSQTAVNLVYTPSPITLLFNKKINNSAEKLNLVQFANTNIAINSSLYLISLAIREGIKGRYLGIKQIGKKLSDQEKEIFTDFSEGYYSEKEELKQNALAKTEQTSDLIPSCSQQLAVSFSAEFFSLMKLEMKNLIKKEEFLTRRVELERFALSQLHLFSHPFESSFTTIVKKCFDNLLFPELIYLISDLFPTQAPYKLLSSAVMRNTLAYRESQEETGQFLESVSGNK